ncbi:protein-lysine N-methyltransferase EEF2KMT isoform X2 [Zootermopsis nevadensis]|uniref:protein-lysine N-methyltransferase EEF2KMT isoform X2 n=1 Tax=Zootermopsis nevadensis TaxID=136037 RepID=UPI000B8EB3BB|nr:protein-lysine N-methyltransferase EEF2KMT isoform X2 [Zootermopsis nevadensis]
MALEEIELIKLSVSDLLHELCSRSNNSMLAQKLLLENTVNHPLVKKFPLKLSYQLAFLKDIISKLERHGQEVLDELYAAYCHLLSVPNIDSGTHYRHFAIDDCGTITLRESSKLISQGTTGLCSWQAALALADWCLCNCKFLQNRHVLELGSGVGLTGLCVSLHCKPSTYWFSDCHPAVLCLLQSNILLNVTGQNAYVPGDSYEEHAAVRHTHSDDRNVTPSACEGHKQTELCDRRQVLLRTRCNNTETRVLNLPWETVPMSNIVTQISPEVVLAADVVYDVSLFPVLCQAFCHLLFKRPCILLLACTVRNKETLDAFMQLLKKAGLEAAEEDLPPPTFLYYSTDVPVKLYRVSANT